MNFISRYNAHVDMYHQTSVFKGIEMNRIQIWAEDVFIYIFYKNLSQFFDADIFTLYVCCQMDAKLYLQHR